MRFSLQRMVCAALPALVLVFAAAARADDDVIANLGTQPVKASEIRDLLPVLTPAQREQAAKDPKVIGQLVRNAVGRKVVLDEALKQSWEKKPEVAEQLARTRNDLIIATYLQSVALPSSSYPSDDEIRQAYQANREKFAIAKEYHLAQIFIAVAADAKKDAAAAAERKARELGRKAKAKDADFAELARASSQDVISAPRGGDLGWLAENQIVPEIVKAIQALGGKGVTDPIHAAGGWHIVQVIGTAGPFQPPLEQVHDVIVKLLRESRANEYMQKLLDDKRLTVNETAAVGMFTAKP